MRRHPLTLAARRPLARLTRPLRLALVAALPLGCAGGLPLHGQSADVAWEVIDLASAVAPDGRETRWTYTIVLRELAGDGLRDTACRSGPELDGGVAVALDAPDLGHRVRGSGDDAHRDDTAVLGEEPRHAELAPDQANRHSNLTS